MEATSPEAPDQFSILGDMTESRGSPRDLTPPQITELRDLFSDRDIGLWHFNREVFGFRDLKWDFHGPICQFAGHWGESHLTDGTVIDKPPIDEDVALSFRRLMIGIPRECFKTSCFTRGLSLWTLATKDHDATIGIFNEKEENPESWIAAICQVVENSVLFQVLWREMIPKGIGFWDRDRGVSPSKKLKWGGTGVLFNRGSHGVSELSIEPHGIGGAATGKHFTHKILDDIIGLKAKESQAVMEASFEWVDHARALERPLEGGCEIINHTTWTHADVYKHIKEKWPGEYLIYTRSLLENPDTGEPDDVNGVSTFPEKIPTKKAYQMKAADEYVFCSPGYSPITMADWTTRPISMVHVGDKVVGVEFGDGRRRLCKSEVLDRGSLYADVWEYELSDGSKVECTEDHYWLSRRNTYQRLRVGSMLQKVHDWEPCPLEDELTAQWLSGFFDGDGSLTGRPKGVQGKGFICFTQTNNHPPVMDRLKKSLDELGFDWKEYHRQDTEERGWSDSWLVRINGGRRARQRFLDWCRPAKSESITESLYGHKPVSSCPLVVRRRNLGPQEVFWLHTTTGNYISWGCFSKNSAQYQLRPKAGKSQSFNEAWDGHFHLIQMGEEPAIFIDRTGGSDGFRPDIFDRDCGEEFAPQIVPLIQCERVVILDPAPSKPSEIRREPKARNGIVVAAIDPWGRRFCLEAIPSRDGPTEILELCISLYRKWAAQRIAIEEVNFSAVYQPLWTRILELDPRYQDVRPEFAATYPRGRDKTQRIRDRLIPIHENSLWYYNTGTTQGDGRIAGPCAYLLKEKSDFPYMETVDLLDAQAYTDEVLVRPPTVQEERRAVGRRQTEDRGITGYGW